MAIITQSSISGSIGSPNKPRIGYRNLFREGTVTVSSEDADHPKEMAFDGFTYDWWEGAGGSPTEEWIKVQVPGSPTKVADYMAIAAHTLAGATLTPQRSSDGLSWTNLESPLVAADNRLIVWEWDAVAAEQWRLLIQNASGTVRLGAIHVGQKLVTQRGLPVGWVPPSLNEERKYMSSGSEGGQSLGRSLVRRGASVDVNLMHSEFTWTREEWASFVEEAERYAVFFWWVNEGKADLLYGQLMDSKASFSSEDLISASFKLEGIIR